MVYIKKCCARADFHKKPSNLIVVSSSTKKYDPLTLVLFYSENNKSAFDAKDAVSSRDSVQAILQSDMENIETDVDDAASMYVVKDSAAELGHYPEPCYVSGNHNLIVNNYNDNFQAQAKDQKPSETNASSNREAKPHRSRNRELEKRKLSQNLDNFSVRLSKNGVNSVVLKDNVNTNSSNDLHAESGNSAAEISLVPLQAVCIIFY